MIALVEQLKTSTQLRWNKVHRFKAKIEMQTEMGPYIIKTATSSEELIEGFKLRHQVFKNEFCGLTGAGLDFDRFDFFFDHLMIIHKESKKIIGTYRLNCSKFSRQSYTALEFDIQSIFANPGPHLELGRACIAPEFRKGSVISLLWRGIAEYMVLSGSQILFGCSSLKINSPRESALVIKYLHEQNSLTENYPTPPTSDFKMEGFDSWYAYFQPSLNDSQKAEAESLIPSLLKSYLKLGAQVTGEPAFDREFDCIDILTVLRRENLSKLLAQKFQIVR
jgi:putative hemolysin